MRKLVQKNELPHCPSLVASVWRDRKTLRQRLVVGLRLAAARADIDRYGRCLRPPISNPLQPEYESGVMLQRLH
jgi:hypothetical protein